MQQLVHKIECFHPYLLQRTMLLFVTMLSVYLILPGEAFRPKGYSRHPEDAVQSLPIQNHSLTHVPSYTPS